VWEFGTLWNTLAAAEHPFLLVRLLMIELVGNGFRHRRATKGFGAPASGRLPAPVRPRRLALFAVVFGLCTCPPGFAFAAEPDDCGPRPTDKTEPACSAIINDAARSDADHTRAYVNRARTYSNNAKYDLALTDAEAALRLDARSVPALLLRGFAFERKNALDVAGADFDRAIEIDPQNIGGFLSRGDLRLIQRRWSDAQNDFEAALRLAQDNPTAHIGRGRVYLETGDLDKALTELNTAVAISANLPYAYFWRGQIYRRKGDIDHGIEDFSRVIAQSPRRDISAYFARGRLYIAKSDYARAIADFNSVLEIAPDNSEARQLRQSAEAMQAELGKVSAQPSGRASATASNPETKVQNAAPPLATIPLGMALIDQAKRLFDQRKFTDAIEILGRVLATDPYNEAGLRMRALAQMQLNRPAQAHADLDQLILLKPNDIMALSLRAVALASLNQTQQGMQDVERALAIDPNSAAALFSRGLINRQLRRFPEALADFDRTIAVNPKDSFAFTQRGLTHLAMNEAKASLVDFDQALALNQSNELARAARGLALLTSGNSAEGIADLNAVLERDPANQVALLGRGLAMFTSGQFDRAIIAFNQIIGKSADDSGARLLRARAYLAQKDTKNAMSDADYVSSLHPGDPELLTVRGLIWSAMHDYGKAIDDLNQAIAKRETVENYIARGTAYEARNDATRAAADFRHALQLAPKNIFDLVAQAAVKQKVEQLSKKVPCGSSAGADSSGTCL
jgi:tetratricopeptide (TPR) repeat protein